MLPKRVVEDIIGRALSGFACQRSGRAAYARALAQRINVVAECMSKRATLASRSTTHPPEVAGDRLPHRIHAFGNRGWIGCAG